jgi:Tfp pilus assembly protein FimT
MADKRYRFRAAFTVIELTAVVTVLSILAVLALPSIAGQDDLTASAAARCVVGDLLYAQSQAIATQTNQYVVFSVASANGSWGSYSLYNNAACATPITNPVTLGPYTQAFGEQNNSSLASVALSGITLDSPQNIVLAFNELGQPYVGTVGGSLTALNNTGSIQLQCGSMAVTISVEPSTGNLTVSQ